MHEKFGDDKNFGMCLGKCTKEEIFGFSLLRKIGIVVAKKNESLEIWLSQSKMAGTYNDMLCLINTVGLGDKLGEYLLQP